MVNPSFDGGWNLTSFDEGGGGLILSTLFLFVKTIEKVNFLILLHDKIFF